MTRAEITEATSEADLRDTYVIVYDDHCNICKKSRQMLSEHELRESIVTLGAHTDLARTMYSHLPIGKKLVVARPDGTAAVGGEALIASMGLTKKYHRLARTLSRFSGTRWAVEIAWRAIARNRMLFSRAVKCDDACGL